MTIDLERLILAYLGIAFMIACVQWWDNHHVYYVRGNPSGCLTGLVWPVWVAIIIGFGVYRIFSLARQALNKERPA